MSGESGWMNLKTKPGGHCKNQFQIVYSFNNKKTMIIVKCIAITNKWLSFLLKYKKSAFSETW